MLNGFIDWQLKRTDRLHALEMDCKGVLSIRVERILVRNRVSNNCLTRFTLSSLVPVNYVGMVLNPLWRRPGNTHGFVFDG